MAIITNTSDVGEAIKSARKSQNMTHEQLAAVAGVGVRFVRELEQGKESCHISKAINVLNMLGLNLTLKGDE